MHVAKYVDWSSRYFMAEASEKMIEQVWNSLQNKHLDVSEHVRVSSFLIFRVSQEFEESWNMYIWFIYKIGLKLGWFSIAILIYQSVWIICFLGTVDREQ